MTLLVVLSVLEIVVLIAALAFYLFWVGTLLARIAGNLEECAEIVRGIAADAALIGPGVEHINQTGGVVAGALPLLYGMAEEIVADVTPRPEEPAVSEPARPASGTRRSRLLDSVGFPPRLSRTEPWRLASRNRSPTRGRRRSRASRGARHPGPFLPMRIASPMREISARPAPIVNSAAPFARFRHAFRVAMAWPYPVKRLKHPFFLARAANTSQWR
jgi:hypothetical protein